MVWIAAAFVCVSGEFVRLAVTYLSAAPDQDTPDRRRVRLTAIVGRDLAAALLVVIFAAAAAELGIASWQMILFGASAALMVAYVIALRLARVEVRPDGLREVVRWPWKARTCSEVRWADVAKVRGLHADDAKGPAGVWAYDHSGRPVLEVGIYEGLDDLLAARGVVVDGRRWRRSRTRDAVALLIWLAGALGTVHVLGRILTSP
jgi:hypothetical protein